MSKAFRVTTTPFRLRHLWRDHSKFRRVFGLYVRWGSEEVIAHTGCTHHRFGPFVLHVYRVKP